MMHACADGHLNGMVHARTQCSGHHVHLAGHASAHVVNEAVKLVWEPAGAAMSVLQCLVQRAQVTCFRMQVLSTSLDIRAQQILIKDTGSIRDHQPAGVAA